MKPRVIGMVALGWAFAQLSGVINQYAAVTTPSDPSNLIVDNPALFAPGDRILVYQAKGASISTANNINYGDISDINGAGLFEFNTIASISGNSLALQCPLTRPFDLSNPITARIQVIKVSYHTGDVTITGTVTAPAWDGQKGGVVVIETEGTLTFSADIDVSGRGFRGGLRSMNGGSSSTCNHSNYHGNADDQGGQKGEGIAEWAGLDHRAYRGKLANGGGGGNNHNTGGAGGANFGAGGRGGWTTCGARFSCPDVNVANSGFGIGGTTLSPYLSPNDLRLFLGGGGGGGHQNNEQGGNGGNGGGIVILRAASIHGGGRQILARGAQGIQNLGQGCNQTNVAFAGNDGGGGGGAGGSVAIFCSSFSGTLSIDVRGADGQNCSSHLCACNPDHGPGGGGGGGYAAFSTPTVPVGVSVSTAGGQNGTELTPVHEPGFGCQNITNCIPSGPDRYHRGATAGAAGGTLHDVSFSSYAPCPLSQLILQRWETTSLPTSQLKHDWTVVGKEPISNILLRLIKQPEQTVHEYLIIGQAEDSYLHPLEPGTYEAFFAVRGTTGRVQVLGHRRIEHKVPFVWGNDLLYLTNSEGEPFFLYDAQGRLLLHGITPQVISLESQPVGLYILQMGDKTYRVHYWR
ncbi:MAG: hypothetical protein N3E49_04265 [Bacteroidia bacterium]|nr:hypothetical protein [Bacteroidia bacterium]